MNDEPSHWSQHWLQQSLRRGFLAYALWPVSALYHALWWIRLQLWLSRWRQPQQLPVPVVVVGNVVAGGAGKTPTTIALIDSLRQQGFSPGVISRGYGRRSSEIVIVASDTPAVLCGDEPLLIRRTAQVPVAVGSDRVKAGRQLLQVHPELDVLVCDDGLQHWRLHRDAAVAVFDERGIGNGWLLPAGLLREPWPNCHPWGPDALLQLTHANLLPELANPRGLPLFSAQRHLSDTLVNLCGEQRSLAAWISTDRPVRVVCGIAKPQRFIRMLTQRGVRVLGSHALADHASTTALCRAIEQTTGDIMCTEKDAVKIGPVLAVEDRSRVWVVGLVVDLPPGLIELLVQRMRGYHHRHGPETIDFAGVPGDQGPPDSAERNL